MLELLHFPDIISSFLHDELLIFSFVVSIVFTSVCSSFISSVVSIIFFIISEVITISISVVFEIGIVVNICSTFSVSKSWQVFIFVSSL